MQTEFELFTRAVPIGIGATVVMDLWAAVLRQLGIPSLKLSLLGRWVGHLGRGRLIHQDIGQSAPVRGERLLGVGAHYGIGVSFAALLLFFVGEDWVASPRPGPAVLLGVVTVLAPWFILQPGLGAGIASSKTKTPLFNALKSLVTHTVFGVGLYLAALAGAIVPWSAAAAR